MCNLNRFISHLNNMSQSFQQNKEMYSQQQKIKYCQSVIYLSKRLFQKDFN